MEGIDPPEGDVGAGNTARLNIGLVPEHVVRPPVGTTLGYGVHLQQHTQQETMLEASRTSVCVWRKPPAGAQIEVVVLVYRLLQDTFPSKPTDLPAVPATASTFDMMPGAADRHKAGSCKQAWRL